VDAFCFTTLLLLPQDYAERGMMIMPSLKNASCGCPWRTYGFTEHIATFEVSITRPVKGTLVGSEMVHHLEEFFQHALEAVL